MKTNERMEADILAAIRDGNHKFYSIMQAVVLPSRVVDRRLQAMRKRGLITFNSKTGWTVK